MAESDHGTPIKLKEMLIDPAESPFEMAVHQQNRAIVESALSRVPDPFRTTLILRDIEGFVYEEVAEIQGVNLGTVKSRLVRGRALLRAILMESQPGREKTTPARIEISLGGEAR